MRLLVNAALCAVLGVSLISAANGQPAPAPPGQVFDVRLAASLTAPASGRLIIMARPLTDFLPAGQPVTAESIRRMLEVRSLVGLQPDSSGAPNAATIARADVRLTQGQVVELNDRDLRFPGSGVLPPGTYLVEAVLDTNLDFGYRQHQEAGDLVSDVVVMQLPTDHPVLEIHRVVPTPVASLDRPPISRELPPEALAPEKQRLAAKSHAERVELPSKLLTAFHGRPTPVKAYVLTPPSYGDGQRYPVVLWFGGFGATMESAAATAQRSYDEMATGASPSMIWVFLDHSGPTGTHEFADSANNGPWGQALTEEFLPWLDATYRTDGAGGRFTTGHSSGGWAALWLQVRYPKLFAGTWPTAPDPADFHDFTNVDIYATSANAYRRPDGAPTQLVRAAANRPARSFETYGQLEQVLGEAGGQFASFEWVFSPRGADGRPLRLFDRASGAVDPKVAAYWRDNYDIAYRIRRDWRTLKPDLDGKIHLWVGTADTFHLDGPARLLKATLDSLGARSEFHFIDGADHATLTTLGQGRPGTLERRIAWEIFAQARPNSPVRQPPP
jgi:enterochelin esterase-like enzyme